MPRWAKRDANDAEIVKGLKDAFFQVVDLTGVGGGCPDKLIVSPQGLQLLELKVPKTGRLSDRQIEWHADFRGPPGTLHVATTLREALEKLNRIRLRRP